MNGGVSLAIWMSGVTLELDRLRRGEATYGRLLDLAHATARVDVIAGASAGGLAGTLLATAIAYDGRVEGARDLWIEKGGIADMLRDPQSADPPSLLRGDDYFLAEVRGALEAIAASGPRREGASGHDLHLLVTATTLTGEAHAFQDRFGNVIRDYDHRGAFWFRRTGERNDFAHADALRRLALAARTTSSFPGAFEPSFIPVADGDGQRPAMGDIATFTLDRWAVDGGVLVNTPFGRALEAIAELPAEREVRRVLAYVVASTGKPETERAAEDAQPDGPDEMPSLRAVVMDALSDLPRVQGAAQELEEITQSNRRVEERRKARRELLARLDADALGGLAEALLPAYVQVRAQSAATAIAEHAVEAGGRPGGAPPATPVDRAGLRADLAPDDGATPPWLPRADAAAFEFGGDAGWTWGIAPVEYAGNVVLDFLRLAIALPRLDERAAVAALRGRLHRALAELRAIQADNVAFWHEHGHALSGAPPERRAAILGEWREAHARRLGDVAAAIAQIAVEGADAVAAWAGADAERRAATVARMARTLAPERPSADARRDAALRGLLALHVLQRVGGGDLAGIEQGVELVQISANVENALDEAPARERARARAKEKLAGLQLHHFGAFYKGSWRANDWLWGRLDAAAWLAKILLDPPRLRRLREDDPARDAAWTASALAATVAAAAADDDEAEVLQRGWTETELAQELAFLDDPSLPLPPQLPRCWRALTRALQFPIMRAELKTVIEIVRADLDRGYGRGLGAAWAAELEDELSPAAALAAFASCRIGEEVLRDELDSRQFREFAERTARVSVEVLSGAGSGAPALVRTITRRLRLPASVLGELLDAQASGRRKRTLLGARLRRLRRRLPLPRRLAFWR